MTFRYIGSKARIVSEIIDTLGAPTTPNARFVDLFCGTGAVALGAAKAGWPIHLNDHLHCAVTMAEARLIGHNHAKFSTLGGYQRAIDLLNALPGQPGFLFHTYSPASAKCSGIERRYFTERNAARIDAVRERVGQWKEYGAIDHVEERLLIADLMSAANRIANIAGTYGCFLSKWQRQAMCELSLISRNLPETSMEVTVSVSDAAAVATWPSDVVYVDPPYTKRQYSAYYHLLETITLGDHPDVEGVAGLRPWKRKASDFCYKSRAMQAFGKLLSALPADRILVSYSDNAHVAIDALATRMKSLGAVDLRRLGEVGRYRPNQAASDGRATVNEYIVELKRMPLRAAA